MRAYLLVLLVMLGGCSFGETVGLYDLPQIAEAPAGGFPELVPEGELMLEPRATADADAELAALALRASRLRQEAALAEAGEEPDSIAVRAAELRAEGEAARQRGDGDGLTEDGLILLQRAVDARNRADL